MTFLFVVVVGVWGTFLLRTWRSISDRRANRQLDHYLDTVTHVSEPDQDGYRTLSISNKGGGVRIEDVVRGKDERAWILASAMRCDWTRRFIKDPNPKQQARILHVIRNAMTRHFVDGENAYDAGESVVETDYYFAPTGADAAVGGVRMIRILWATENTLRICAEHPVDKWKYEIDKATGLMQDHSVRLTSMREMADALFNHDGCREHNGQMIRIIGWMRGRVRA